MEPWVQSLLILSIVMVLVTSIFMAGYHFGIKETQRVQLMHLAFMSRRTKPPALRDRLPV